MQALSICFITKRGGGKNVDIAMPDVVTGVATLAHPLVCKFLSGYCHFVYLPKQKTKRGGVNETYGNSNLVTRQRFSTCHCQIELQSNCR